MKPVITLRSSLQSAAKVAMAGVLAVALSMPAYAQAYAAPDNAGGAVTQSSQATINGTSFNDSDQATQALAEAFAKGGTVTVKGTVALTQEIHVPEGVFVTLQGGGTITRGTLEDGSDYLGRLVVVNPGAQLTLDAITFNGGYNATAETGTVSDGMLILCNGALVMRDGAVLTGNCTSQYGAAVRTSGTADQRASFVMMGGLITGNCSVGTQFTSGGGVHVSNNSDFTMLGGTIVANKAQARGGAVHVTGDTDENRSFFTMKGGKIENNTSDVGAGVSIDHGGTFMMLGGEISGNHAANLGGGVFLNAISNKATPTMIMEGGTIADNKADVQGGGVNVNSYARFTLKDGSITTNYAPQGGGVVVSGAKAATPCEFTMEGGSITGNTATHGAAIFESMYSVVVMNGGILANNTATQGGAVYDYAYANFIMQNGTMQNNKAAMGGAVCVGQLGNFTMEGGSITGNIAANAAGGDAAGGGIMISSSATSFTMTGGIVCGNELGPVNEGRAMIGTDLFLQKAGLSVAEVASDTFTADGGEVTGWFVDGTQGAGLWAQAEESTHFENGTLSGSVGLIAAYCKQDAGTDWERTAEASCTESGSETHLCEAHQVVQPRVILASHTPGEWTTEGAPVGCEIQFCTVCGEQLDTRFLAVAPVPYKPTQPTPVVPTNPIGGIAQDPAPQKEPEPLPVETPEEASETVAIPEKPAQDQTKQQTAKTTPKKAAVSKIVAKKKAIKLTWKAPARFNVTGMQIKMATNKKFTTGKKVVKVKGAKTTGKTVKGLKSGKTYYVKMRAYKVVKGKIVYGPWSSVRKATVK